jgi:hypothetical protein
MVEPDEGDSYQRVRHSSSCSSGCCFSLIHTGALCQQLAGCAASASHFCTTHYLPCACSGGVQRCRKLLAAVHSRLMMQPSTQALLQQGRSAGPCGA